MLEEKKASYCKNEEAIGEALSHMLNEGKVKREELFINSKIWHTEKEDIEAALTRSLHKLVTWTCTSFTGHPRLEPRPHHKEEPNLPRLEGARGVYEERTGARYRSVELQGLDSIGSGELC